MNYNDDKDDLKNYRKEFVEFTEDMVKQLDHHQSKNLFSIHHYQMIVIFENRPRQ